MIGKGALLLARSDATNPPMGPKSGGKNERASGGTIWREKRGASQCPAWFGGKNGARGGIWRETASWLLMVLVILVCAPSSCNAATQTLKFNRSQFIDLSDPCSRTGTYNTILNRTRPVALLKLDIRYKSLVTFQTFNCIIKVKTEFMNKSREFYNENEDIAVMMFDINYGYRRKDDAIKLDLIHIAKLDQNGTRFFYQKKKFKLPQYIPHSLPGYVLYGFEEIAQWHAESNSSVAVNLSRWKSSDSIYFVFAQYRIVSPYHCDTGIEVDCNDNAAVFAHCFPSHLLSLFLDGLPFCEFHPLHAIGSNRTTCGGTGIYGISHSWSFLVITAIFTALVLPGL